MIIAIDGPAASGKGTLARRLAEYFDFAYLDTGKLYRAVGLGVLRIGGDPEDEDQALDVAQNLDPAQLDDPDLKGDDAAQAASKVAAIQSVRAALLDFQKTLAAHPPGGKAGAILDGRDIGTVVCPEAEAKLFVTASVEERANRRHKELLDRGETSIYERVLADLKERDARDSSRAVAPLKPADDATVIDTSQMNADEAFDKAVEIIQPIYSASARD
ncbi:(d)CMP kinase [Aestuariispira insulae]|uniref:Cytidylate kinase n=1 Tax=Aestuariispira insulae TaxID=1461337 RepID=A0A3D9H9F0_9PROT|nr:(d)CMP kinase [Aestuariispira insulae]RED46114.1 cytidylate kinase [Aestuariispira insulae]